MPLPNSLTEQILALPESLEALGYFREARRVRRSGSMSGLHLALNQALFEVASESRRTSSTLRRKKLENVAWQVSCVSRHVRDFERGVGSTAPN